MRRGAEDQRPANIATRDAHVQGITPLDRETLEEVMRDDAFLAGDDKALSLNAPEVWARARRHGRRA